MPTYTRFTEFIESLSLKNRAAIAEKLQITRQTLSNFETGNTDPKLSLIEKLKSNYPRLNLNWLFTGRGKMWLESNDNEIDGLSLLEENKAQKEKLLLYEKETDNIRAQMKLMDKYIIALEKNVAALEKTVSELEEEK